MTQALQTTGQKRRIFGPRGIVKSGVLRQEGGGPEAQKGKP
jgi:hypothetical protein